MQDAPTTRRTATRRLATRSLFLLVGVALALVAYIALTRPGPGADPGLPVTQEGGMTWKSTIVHRGGDSNRVTAEVELDGKAFPKADDRDDQFVMYQLAGGRFDSDEHVDDRAAERVLGLSDDDNIMIVPTEDGIAAGAEAQPRAGEYTLSLDGTVEYRDIPKGTWELRAYAMDRSGRWDGPAAIRTFTVR